MQWIRESNDIDGVRYKSSLNTNLVQGMGAINVALPVKKFREDGLDEKLTAKITISDIGYLDINKDFRKYKKILTEIEQFKNDLRIYMIEAPFWGSYMMELIDGCECVIKTYNALMEGDYTNSELLFNHVERLYDYTSLLYKSCEMKIQECVDAESSYNRGCCVDIDKIKEQFEQFHNLMRKILHKHTVFSFGFENLDNYEKI